MVPLEFIVAEISKTWTECGTPAKLLSQMFEEVIATNLERGYVLYSFSHSQVAQPGVQQETIIAVFRLVRSKRSQMSHKP